MRAHIFSWYALSTAGPLLCRKVYANGAVAFRAILTGLNSHGEPILGIWTQSASLQDVLPELLAFKEGITRRGGVVSHACVDECSANTCMPLCMHGHRNYVIMSSETGDTSTEQLRVP
jgi:hypothetical protein